MRRFSVELCCTFLSTSLDPLGVEDCQTPMLQTCSMCNLKEGHRNFKEFCLNPKLLNDELMSDDSGSSDVHILTLLFSLAFTFFNCWLSKPSYETRWCKHQNGRALHRKFGYVAIPAVPCFLRRTARLTPVAGSASEVLCHFWYVEVFVVEQISSTFFVNFGRRSCSFPTARTESRNSLPSQRSMYRRSSPTVRRACQKIKRRPSPHPPRIGKFMKIGLDRISLSLVSKS